MTSFRVRLAKEAFKFSATHFTMMSSNEAERLHGHNYHVSIECQVTDVDALGMAFEFNSLKPLIKAATQAWDERVLIPLNSPHLKIGEENVRGESHWTVDFANRSYRFPKADVKMLACRNVTSEELARLFAESLATAWSQAVGSDQSLAKRVQTLAVTVEETRGQSASFLLQSPFTAKTSGAAR